VSRAADDELQSRRLFTFVLSVLDVGDDFQNSN
jgi:hypothetical protein